MKNKISVLLVDDHPVFRKGLRVMLEEEGISVAGEAGDGEEAVDQSPRTGSRRDRDGHLDAGDGRDRGHPADHGGVARHQGAPAFDPLAGSGSWRTCCGPGRPAMS